ncbi:hypothetical protein DESC_320018 [Desulfosarcina cetonica]|nr:hypothetical protein DESC_320018 [Desulfosarcina cetonica]
MAFYRDGEFLTPGRSGRITHGADEKHAEDKSGIWCYCLWSFPAAPRRPTATIFPWS